MNRLVALLIAVPLLTAVPVAGAQDAPPAVQAAVTTLMPEMKPSWLKPAPIEGMWEVAFGPHIFYISGDGRHLLRGDILDVTTRSNLTKPARNKARRDAVESLGEANMIVFKPEKQDFSVTVFTDVDCGYCAKLHSEMQSYMDAGIAIRYVAFPRAGVGSDSYDTMVSVWCAADQQQAMTMAKARQPVEPRRCENPVAQQYEMGHMVGVRGTPTIVMETGDVVPGYMPATRLRDALEKARADSRG
jgi:thiol:disulfide interchange protein DsbC